MAAVTSLLESHYVRKLRGRREILEGGEDDEDEEEEEEEEDDDDEYENEDVEEEEVGGCGSPPIAEASLIVPIVGNHNQQCNNINANFEGSSSYLAILYELLLATFSK